MTASPRRNAAALLMLLRSTALLGAAYFDPPAEPAIVDAEARGQDSHRLSPLRRLSEAVVLEDEEVAESAPWRSDQVMVKVSSAEVAEALAAEHSSEVLHTSRRGLVALRVPDGRSPQGFLTNLRADPRVLRGGPMGITRGTGSRLEQPELRASEYQWHLIASRAPLPDMQDVSDYIVAVLDTGVAYEDYDDFTQVPSLAGVRFVDPYDFVSDDDHQHGTHITSLIASEGAVEGVAAGASIMPLKVLDA